MAMRLRWLLPARLLLSDEAEAQAQEYVRLKRRLWFAGLALAGSLLALVTFGGPALWLRDVLERTGLPGPAVAALFFAAGFVAYEVVSLPLGYYDSYVLPHRYGLSVQTRRSWAEDRLKGLGLALGLGAPLIAALNWLMAEDPQGWWLPAGFGVLLVTVVLANLAPVLLVPIFYKLEPIENRRLVDRLTRLAETAGARVRGVYQMRFSDRTRAANAALMGLGNTRQIVLSDTMLERYTPDEIETVIAHELGHHVHADIPIGILWQSALMLAGFWLASLVIGRAAGALGLRGSGDPAALALFALVMGAYGLLTLPLANWLVRWAEWRADRFALRLTGRPDAFISAMERLAADNLAEREPPAWVELLLYDHPSIGRRVAAARIWAGAHGVARH